MVLFTIRVVISIKNELKFIVINSINNILESAVKWGVCRGWNAEPGHWALGLLNNF